VRPEPMQGSALLRDTQTDDVDQFTDFGQPEMFINYPKDYLGFIEKI